MGFRNCSYKFDKVAEKLGVSMDTLNEALRSNRIGGFARLWEFSDKGGEYPTGNVRISVSKKKNDGTYSTEFQDGFVSVYGAAYELAKTLEIPHNGVPICITNCDVRNKYDETKRKMYTNFMIYDFELSDYQQSPAPKSEKPQASKKSTAASKPVMTEVDDDDLPF